MSSIHLVHLSKRALVAALIIAVLGMFVFFTVEPTVGRATITSEFTVTQEIIDEISFLVEAADVTMVGSLQGLTGGYATGTTYTVVRTNDPDGYSMFLAFSSSTAMNNRDFPNLFFINNYSLTATTVPDYDWVEDGTSAEFGYTVSASTTLDLYRYFLDNGTNCNIPGGGDTLNKCWMTPSSTDLVVGDQIINRTTASTDGATTTLKFRVVVPSNPSPSLPSGFYVATATLTATNNP